MKENITEKQQEKQGKKAIPIGNTPFRTYGDEENGYSLLIGDSIVSEKTFSTREEAKKYVQKKEWDLLSVTILVLIEKYISMGGMREKIENDIKKQSKK